MQKLKRTVLDDFTDLTNIFFPSCFSIPGAIDSYVVKSSLNLNVVHYN